MKWLKRILVGFAVVLGLLFLISWGLGRKWARDVDSLQVKTEANAFSAQRDKVTGVWSLEADSPENLAFAFGYIQMQDREFQLELMRNMATGRLSAWFGASMLKRDRLGRLFSRAARREWAQLPPKSDLRTMVEGFIKGRREYLAKNPDRVPVEFRLFGLERKEVTEWEPWEIFALSRFHSWEFSYDLASEIRSHVIDKSLGKNWNELLLPGEPLDSPEVLYKQSGLRGVKGVSGAQSHVPNMKWPGTFAASSELSSPSRLAMQVNLPASILPGTVLGSQLGASNLWIVANPRTALLPMLCNDTHLGFSWPGPLYPIRYRMKDIDAQGFMLPGSPALVIGRVDRPGKNLSWGITIANYADAQDLVALNPATLKKAHGYAEKFGVNDPKAATLTTQEIPESWTEFGPRIDEIMDWKGGAAPGPLALDWIGFRDAKTPMEFYVHRTLQGADGLREDLEKNWDFPSVNFAWVERDEKNGIRIGHRMTGYVFEQSKRSARKILSETEARSRRISSPAGRPWLDEKYGAHDPFLLVSANQSIYPQPLSSRLAWEWGDRARARRLLELKDELFAHPEKPQNDIRSLSLIEFVRAARTMLPSGRLCAQGEAQYLKACVEVISTLDAWDGTMSEKEWVPTLAALWYAKTKMNLWPADFVKANPALQPLFSDWHASTSSMRALPAVMNSPEVRAKWEKLSGKNWIDELAGSFQESLEVLLKDLGPLSSSWLWGDVHHISWMHPVKFIPEPLGSMLAGSLLGAPISVPGSIDTPARFDFAWNPAHPSQFPSRAGAAMRMCTRLSEKPGPSTIRWTAATGVSGNPLSKWAWAFARDYYYKGELYPSNGEKNGNAVAN